jgi:dihydrofolate reductase
MLSLIVAIARNRVIGYQNRMPWHLPAELAYFKQITMGHPIIMGRKTFDSIGRPLPGRRNIVVSRNPGWQHEGVELAPSLDAALSMCGREEAFLIGGASLYAGALAYADKLFITEIDAMPPGDTFFPPIDGAQWREVSRRRREADERNPHAIEFVVLENALAR